MGGSGSVSGLSIVLEQSVLTHSAAPGPVCLSVRPAGTALRDRGKPHSSPVVPRRSRYRCPAPGSSGTGGSRGASPSPGAECPAPPRGSGRLCASVSRRFGGGDSPWGQLPGARSASRRPPRSPGSVRDTAPSPGRIPDRESHPDSSRISLRLGYNESLPELAVAPAQKPFTGSIG